MARIVEMAGIGPLHVPSGFSQMVMAGLCGDIDISTPAGVY